MRINQAKIASELGVSVITVSRALRNHPDLAEATKERILEKARELGYTRLRTPKPSSTLRRAAVVFYGASQVDPLASGVRRLIFFGLHQQCKVLNTETAIEMPSMSEVPAAVRNRTVEAVFLFGRYTAETVRALGDIPALAVSSYSEGIDIPRITADNFGGMRDAVNHLVEHGHKRVLFIREEEPLTQIFRERERGYEWVMRKNGMPVEVATWNLESDPRPAVLENLPKGSAIAFASDSLAGVAMDYLESKGWELPRDCSIVSFDDTAPASRKLTSFSPDWTLMGKMAADLLLAWPGLPRRTPIEIRVPGRLSVKGSVVSV